MELSSSPLPIDHQFRESGYSVLAGVDEAGRGPLAGPVFAAAVILPPGNSLPGILDSKKFSPARREELYEEIISEAVAWSFASIDNTIIDRVNILQASMKAMVEAVRNLSATPEMILVDGPHTPFVDSGSRALKKGDGISQSIGAASILAKVRRDHAMLRYHDQYPQYGFARHKGYGTREHLEAIAEYGPCPIHRVTFARVREFVKRMPGD
ncbi:MAG: ribonuclease HII [Pseudomonadota bacterium]|jgi:ribonuclease HII